MGMMCPRRCAGGFIDDVPAGLVPSFSCVVCALSVCGVCCDKVDTLKKGLNDSKYSVPSGWAPWAKGFGALLDLNCALIFLPVCRTMIRYLYNRSTADQGCVATVLRGILYFIPLDKNLHFHRVIAKVIMGATIAHTVAHYINFAIRPHAVLFLFHGAWPLVSGGLVCFCMFFIYTSAFENTKKGQFEIFWYSHHVFILFFIFLFTHGTNGLNPGYWRYIIGPGALYLLERLMRIYRARQKVVVLSTTIMDDVFSLEFAKEGVFAVRVHSNPAAAATQQQIDTEQSDGRQHAIHKQRATDLIVNRECQSTVDGVRRDRVCYVARPSLTMSFSLGVTPLLLVCAIVRFCCACVSPLPRIRTRRVNTSSSTPPPSPPSNGTPSQSRVLPKKRR